MRSSLDEKIEEGETSILDSVVFYAILNKKRKFMITSDQNFIDGIKYPRVMIDTGSQMLAIPFPDELTFDQFWTKYSKYNLRIHKAKGMGHISKLSLLVEADNVGKFEISFGNGKKPLVPLTSLRFILSYESAVNLLKTNYFKDEYLHNLKEYIELIDKLAAIVPSLKETPKNGVVLVGQEILQSYYLLQLKHVTLVLMGKEMYTFRPMLIEREYATESERFEKNFKELYDCFEGEGEDSIFGWSPGYQTMEEDYTE